MSVKGDDPVFRSAGLKAHPDLFLTAFFFRQGRDLVRAEKAARGGLDIGGKFPSDQFTQIKDFDYTEEIGFGIVFVFVVYSDQLFHSDVDARFLPGLLDSIVRRGKVVFAPSARHGPAPVILPDQQDFAVQEGIPVTLIINAEEDYITGCNNRVISNDFAFDVTLEPGQNEVRFLPDKNGTFIYSCWMYMLKNKIYVYED